MEPKLANIDIEMYAWSKASLSDATLKCFKELYCFHKLRFFYVSIGG